MDYYGIITIMRHRFKFYTRGLVIDTFNICDGMLVRN